MISFYTTVIFLLVVFFSWVIIHHVFSSFKESFVFIPPYDENAKGDKEDDEDDAFFQKMNAEYKPINTNDVDNMIFELDKEEELSPEETEFIDGNDLELPEQTSNTNIRTSKIREPTVP